MNKNKINEYLIAPEEMILELLEIDSINQQDLANKTRINKETINKIIPGNKQIYS